MSVVFCPALKKSSFKTRLKLGLSVNGLTPVKVEGIHNSHLVSIFGKRSFYLEIARQIEKKKIYCIKVPNWNS